MAKVGRAAYAASRARLEVVTADKTITKNESGELYAVDAGGAVAITLPSDAQNGTRYKFMIIDDAAGAISITTGTSDTQPFQGGITWTDHDTSADLDVVKGNGNSNANVITLASGTEQGSWVIVVFDSDNSRWLLEGFVSAGSAPTIAGS